MENIIFHLFTKIFQILESTLNEEKSFTEP